MKEISNNRTQTIKEFNSLSKDPDRAYSIIPIIVSVAFALLMLYILISVCFLSSMDYCNKMEWFPNALSICLAAPVFFLLSKMPVKHFPMLSKKGWKILLILFFFVIQIQSVYSYFFYTGWDVNNIIPASVSLAHGEPIPDVIVNYYSIYPNNLFLTSVFSSIIRILNMIFPQTKDTEVEYISLLVVQCILNQATGVLIYCAAKRLCVSERFAWIAYALYMILIGISPWVSIPYSDSMGLIFPVSILLLYLKPAEGKKVILKWLTIALLAYISFNIKPQTSMVFIAILIMELFSLRPLILTERKKLFKSLAGLCLGILCGFGIVEGNVRLSCTFQLIPEKRLGFAHFLMMGMNPDNGSWSQEDVSFSKSFETNKERDSADLHRAEERIKTMGFSGLARHFTRKTLTNYNNGTYAWEIEGEFYKTIRDIKGPFSDFWRNLYYRNGRYQKMWMQFAQTVWMSILFLSVFSVFSCKDNRIPVMMLSVIGLSVFLLIFEARARYLFTNVPIFILLAVLGLSNCSMMLCSKRRMES